MYQYKYQYQFQFITIDFLGGAIFVKSELWNFIIDQPEGGELAGHIWTEIPSKRHPTQSSSTATNKLQISLETWNLLFTSYVYAERHYRLTNNMQIYPS